MAGNRDDADREPRPRFGEDIDPDFQRRWVEARDLSWEQVESAWRHGFDARDRFVDRPFEEVRGYLEESWRALGTPAPWDEVEDIVRSGYERYKGAGLGSSTDLATEALSRFERHTQGGSDIGGGVLGDAPRLGDARREPDVGP